MVILRIEAMKITKIDIGLMVVSSSVGEMTFFADFDSEGNVSDVVFYDKNGDPKLAACDFEHRFINDIEESLSTTDEFQYIVHRDQFDSLEWVNNCANF